MSGKSTSPTERIVSNLEGENAMPKIVYLIFFFLPEELPSPGMRLKRLWLYKQLHTGRLEKGKKRKKPHYFGLTECDTSSSLLGSLGLYIISLVHFQQICYLINSKWMNDVSYSILHSPLEIKICFFWLMWCRYCWKRSSIVTAAIALILVETVLHRRCCGEGKVFLHFFFFYHYR